MARLATMSAAGAFVHRRTAPPPVGDHTAGLFHRQQPGCGVGEAGLLEVAGQSPARDHGAGECRAARHADGADGSSDGIEPLIGAAMKTEVRRGQAGADAHVADLGRGAHPQPLTVEERAAALDGGEQLVRHWVVDHPAERLAGTAQRDGDRVVLAVEEVGGAVDRVDQEPMVRIVAVDRGELLAAQAETGVATEQALTDQGLRLEVGVGDEVSRPLHPDVDLAESGEVSLGHLARGAHGLDQVLENCLDVHSRPSCRQRCLDNVSDSGRRRGPRGHRW